MPSITDHTSPRLKGKVMGNRVAEGLYYQLVQHQQVYLDYEEAFLRRMRRDHSMISLVQVVELLKRDWVYKGYQAKEQDLLSQYRDALAHDTSSDYDDEPRCRICGARWERCRKYRGRVDGDRQPTKKTIAKQRRPYRRSKQNFAYAAL